jgi:inner membrane protein
MDSLTHIALGACIGEAFFEKGFGRKAMIWGALAQSIPDIDFIASFWLGTTEDLLAHRGFTHSILFALLITPLFAYVADAIHRPHEIMFRKFLLFFAAEVFMHLFLDSFNNYGVGWFEPFSHHRFSFNVLYVADPFFSIWPGIACLALIILGRYKPQRRFWWKFGLFIPFIYLGYCSINKMMIKKEVNEIFVQQNIPHERYFTTPAPLQNWLWFVVAGNDSGYYVGYRSVFDTQKTMSFEYFPRNEQLLTGLAENKDLQRLKRFSQEFYTAEIWGDTLVFNDLRFGQVIGWQQPKEHFAFHYFLQYPNDNKLVVQRGRFAKWDWQQAKYFVKRVRGN